MMSSLLRSHGRKLVSFAFVVCLFGPGSVTGLEKEERIQPEGIRGALVIAGGKKVPDAVRDRFLELAGGTKAKLVVMSAKVGADEASSLLEPWRMRKVESVQIVSTPSKRSDPAPEALAK